MYKNLSPQSLLVIWSTLCLLVAGTTIALALQLPWSGLQFVTGEENQLLIASRHPASPNPDYQNLHISHFSNANGELIPATTRLLIEEPDVLPDYASYNQLMSWQKELTLAADKQSLMLIDSAGQSLPIVFTPRPLSSLPILFWLQLLFGIGGALTGALVWSTRRYDKAATLYALTGLGYLIFAPAAAVYSTRELLIDGELFRILSIINHFGALLFTASLTSLLYCYPHALKSAKLIPLVYVAALFVWLGDALQWFNPMVFHFGVLGVFSLSFVFAFMQWRRTRQDPLGRAALRWFLLSIYLATGLFAAVIILPAALHLPQPASQGVMFGAFLIMYWGLALGIVRYRLFRLEQWWHSIMAWFLGGLCVLILDIALISSLSLPQDIALSLAVAFTGWLYFPLRQLLWDKLGRNRAPAISDWLPEVLPLLIRSTPTEQSSEDTTLQNMLQRVWHAAEVQKIEGILVAPTIVDDGLTLAVPGIRPDEEHHYKISCAENGQRLFSALDINTFWSLQKISLLALQTVDAHNRGALEERERIRRDIHDDLGARLLTLLHSCPDHLQPLVRELLQETRALVQTLNFYPVDSLTAEDAWQTETRQRCEAGGITLKWHCPPDALPPQMSARTHANITRILREAVSNALKHSPTTDITVSFQTLAESLEISVANSGPTPARETWIPGNGCRTMVQRAEEIGGDVQWDTHTGCRLVLRLKF